MSNLGAMVLAGISGAARPAQRAAGVGPPVAPAAPQYWAMRGFRSTILDGGGVSSVLLPVGVLLAFGVVAGGLALLRFRFDDVEVHASAAP